jgi:hypothetical protein
MPSSARTFSKRKRVSGRTLFWRITRLTGARCVALLALRGLTSRPPRPRISSSLLQSLAGAGAAAYPAARQQPRLPAAPVRACGRAPRGAEERRVGEETGWSSLSLLSISIYPDLSLIVCSTGADGHGPHCAAVRPLQRPGGARREHRSQDSVRLLADTGWQICGPYRGRNQAHVEPGTAA